MTVNTKAKEKDSKTVGGELTFDDKVIQKIIGIALEEVSGILAVDGGFLSNITDKIMNKKDVTTGIGVEVGKEQVAVDISVVAEYGKDIAKLYEEIKAVITREIKAMTDLDVVEVNVKVVDVKTKAQHQQDSVTMQDRVSDAAEATGEFASEQTEKAKETLKSGKKELEKATEKRVK